MQAASSSGVSSQIEVGTDERVTQLVDEPFAGVTGIPNSCAQNRATALRVLCPVRQLMSKGGVVALGIA